MKVIAIDYDLTYSLNPAVMANVIGMCRTIAPVVCVTNRMGTDSDREELKRTLPAGVDVIWCRDKHKHEICEVLGLEVLFVIDDQPESWTHPMPIWLVRIKGAWKWLVNKLIGERR
jgi:hypothetical protein